MHVRNLILVSFVLTCAVMSAYSLSIPIMPRGVGGDAGSGVAEPGCVLLREHIFTTRS